MDAQGRVSAIRNSRWPVSELPQAERYNIAKIAASFYGSYFLRPTFANITLRLVK